MKHDNVPTSVHTFGGKDCIIAPLTVPACLCLCNVSFNYFAANMRREGGDALCLWVKMPQCQIIKLYEYL